MRSGSVTFKLLTILALSSVVLAACSTNVTESDEYQELLTQLEQAETNLDQVQTDRDAARAEAAAAAVELDASEEARAESEVRAQELESEVVAANTALATAEAALDSGSEGPWPDSVKTLFIGGCTADPGDISAEDILSLCTCVTEELEQRVSLTDFLTFSLAFATSDELDPITGFPVDIDDEFIITVTEASVSCALGLA